MKARDIQVGKAYWLRWNGDTIQVKVLSATEEFNGNSCTGWTAWRCLNVVTGRIFTVKSCQKFRYAALEKSEPAFDYSI
jgi:hypothetical protein